MLALQFYKQDEPLFSFQSEKNVIRIGRGKDCDIALPDVTLSRHHCTLHKKDGFWILEDASKNGVLVKGVDLNRLTDRKRVAKSERYRLGRVFSFEVSTDFAPTVEEKTVIISQRPTQLVSLDVASDKIFLGRAKISGFSFKGEAMARWIETDGISIGSHPSNDLVFPLDVVSQFHARIDFVNNEYVLSDLDSTNGTFMNGVRVMKSALPKKASFQVGPYDFQFNIEQTEMEIKPKDAENFLGIISKSKAMKKIFTTCEVVGPTDVSVFIHGETGSGKELLAHALHTLSRRYHGPFIALNCAALPKDLIESELFGHEKGAFTGAQAVRAGAFESADRGTLFLDEIGELDLSLQAKLLRALETGKIQRVGSSHPIQTSVRVISATHRDLVKEMKEGRFREDLFYRLHVIPLHLPALRERIDDLDVLVPYFLSAMGYEFEVEALVIEGLKRHSFSGNIRELKNVLQRACLEFEVQASVHGRSSKVLQPRHFHFMKEISFLKPAVSPEEIEERERILKCLQESAYNQSEAARKLCIPISTFHDKVKRYGLRPPVV